MKIHFIQKFTLTILILINWDIATATNSVAQLRVEGNATCSSLAINSILQAKDTSVPAAGGSDTITGPDGQTFQYSISTTTVAGDTINVWTTTSTGSIKPVNFVVLKGSGNSGGRVFYFNNLGVITDNTEVAPARIEAVSFCYGLSSPIVPVTLPACDPVTLGDVCSADTTRVITIFDESTPNWRVQTCSCATETEPKFTECNPDLQAGTVVPPGIPGPCTNSGGATQFLPVEVQLGRDPDSYYCTVINGTRRCYRK